jgi:hypothetical protein
MTRAEPRNRKRGPCTFKQHDLARALKAGKQAGVPVKVEIVDPSGRKITVTSGDGASAKCSGGVNEWDEVYDNGKDQT